MDHKNIYRTSIYEGITDELLRLYPLLMIKLRLNEALKSRKLSKRKFAVMIGVEYKNVFRLFRPGYDPKLSTLDKWAKALKCSPKDLFK